MTEGRWDRAQQLFEAALDEPAQARRAYLEAACEGDAALVDEVCALLEADERSDAALDDTVGALIPPPLPDLVAGSELEDYRIEAKIGEGGFGSVYRARHRVIGKLAAIKVLHPEHAASSVLAERFVDEARAVNEIGHPNIVDIFGFGKTPDGRLYYVMEYLDAPSLEDMLAARSRLELAEALPLLRGLAAALDAAHDHGVVHRDLKPANVVVSEAGPKLLDFGIAKLVRNDAAAEGRTATGQMLGTPSYMAPEQIRGEAIDGRTDAYAFGVLTYRVLTGELPFAGTNPFDTMVMHTYQAPRPPSQLVPALGRGVDAVVLALLAKDRDDRPSRLTSAVDRLAEGGAAPRKRGAAWLVGIAVGVVVAVTFAFVFDPFTIDDAPSSTVPTRGTVPDDVRPAPAAATPADAVPARPADLAIAGHVEVTLSGPPAGTRVKGPDGKVLGTAPGVVRLPRGTDPVELVLEWGGREQRRVDVVPDDDKHVDVATASRPAKTPRKLNRDLESPFRP